MRINLKIKTTMLGQKDYHEKLFLSFSLSSRIPEDNFYRRLKDLLDLQFIRDMARPYYGTEGQKSIDPTVFFRMMLIGYLENIDLCRCDDVTPGEPRVSLTRARGRHCETRGSGPY